MGVSGAPTGDCGCVRMAAVRPSRAAAAGCCTWLGVVAGFSFRFKFRSRAGAGAGAGVGSGGGSDSGVAPFQGHVWQEVRPHCVRALHHQLH
mgnify:CR=1 FL=1